MDDSTIISKKQVDVTDKAAKGSFRPSAKTPLTTYENEVNVTIRLRNPQFPTTPQLGKFDLLEHESTNVGSYEVYYKKPSESTFTPFNSDPTIGSAETMYDTDNVLFADGTYATEVLIVIRKNTFVATKTEPMTIKFSLFACFIPRKYSYVKLDVTDTCTYVCAYTSTVMPPK